MEKRYVLAATIVGSAMAFIDGSVVNVALSTLQHEFHATVAEVQWVVEAYALFLSALLLVGGALGDRYGRRLVYMIGVAAFALASVGCSLARSMPELIAARALQGIGGALLVPGSLAIITAVFPEDERGAAIGTWSGWSAIMTAVGPILGGWTIDHLSWRWAFAINVPLAAVVLLLSWRHVPESSSESQRRLDFLGAILATAALGAIVYGLIEAGPSGPQWTFIGIGIFLLICFLFAEARQKHPMVPLGLFRSRDFSGANLLTLLLYGALAALFFFFPLNLMQVQGYGATAAGAASLPFVILMFTLSRWAGGLVKRYGSRLPLTIGPAVTAAGFALFARVGVGGSYWTTFFPAMVVTGFGMTVTVAPLTTTVMGAVPQSYVGVASGINNAVSRTAGLLAIAVMGFYMAGAFNASLDAHLNGLAPSARQKIDAQRDRLGAIEPPADLSQQQKSEVHAAVSAAFVDGFRRVALAMAAMALLSGVAAWVLISPGRGRSGLEGEEPSA